MIGGIVSDGEVLKAIDELYSAFAGVRKPRLLSDVPWRPDAGWIGGQSLREVPAAVINEFIDELPSGTIGDAEDVRYLTPRLMDLAFHGELRTVIDDPVLVALALERARWTEWSSREQAAIRGFLAEFLDWCVAGRQATRFQSLVTALAIMFDDLAPWLARVRAHQGVPGVFALLWIAEWVLDDTFLEGRGAQRDQMRAWLRESASFAQVDAVRDTIGVVGPDGDDLRWLFEKVTHWLHVRGAESGDAA